MSKMPPALRAAFSLHPVASEPVSRNATEAEVTAWRTRNLARMSLLNDSWPHKNFAFRRFYGAPILPAPGMLSDDRLKEHHDIIVEEWREFWTALFTGDLVETIDGGLDLIYTVLDLLIAMGIPPAVLVACYEEIHASNMTKVLDDGSPSIVNGKIQKTPNHTQVDLIAAALYATPPCDLLGDVDEGGVTEAA